MISAMLDDVAAGTGRALLIEGEAGIGKTRLLRAAEALASERGLAIARGEADALEQDVPFSAVADALDLRPDATESDRAEIVRLLAGEVTGAAEPESVRFRITEKVTDLLERLAFERPLCLVLDDLHWADERSLLVVDRVARRLAHLPLALMGSFRPHPRRPALARLLEVVHARGGGRLVLAGLSKDESVRLIAERLGATPGPVLRAYSRGTAGNPLYLVELAAAALELGRPGEAGEVDLPGGILPPSLRVTILERLRALPEETLTALRAAAVLGRSFDVRALALVLGRNAPALVADLAPAVQSGALVDRPPSLAFHHDLVRDAVYEDLGESARRALHAAIAQALDAAGYPASQVAEHLVRGWEPFGERAVEVLRRAAEEAAVTDPGRAVELLRRALEATDLDHPDRAPMMGRLAEVLAWSGHVEEAERLLLGVMSSGGSSAAALWALLQVRYVRGNVDHDTIDRVERVVRERSAGTERRSLLARLARLSADAGEADRALQLADEVLAEEDGAAPPEVVCDAFNARATALFFRGVSEEAIIWADRSYAQVRADAVAPYAAIDTALVFGRYAGPREARREEALEAVRLAARLAEEYGQTWALAAAHQYVGYCHYFAGDWDSAVPALETAVAAAEETGFLKLLPAGLRLLAAVALDRGDLSAARRYLAHSDRLADQGVTHSSVRYPTELVRAELALAEGRTDDAVELLRSAPAWVESSTRDWILAHVAFRLAATGRRLGRDGLLDAANELLGAPPDGEAPRMFAFAAAALVDLDPELAARMAEAQREFLKPDYAELCEAAGLAFACVEQRDEAIRWYQQARDVWATARAGRRLAQVDAWLRNLGVRRRGRIDRGRPLSGWGSLTDAEVRVAELVAEGLLYREVADRLFLSRRTVETHVAHILRKLGLRNRAELAADYARRHSEAPPTDR